MTTVLIFVAGWLVVAIFAGWIVAQCIDAMAEPDPMEQVDAETAALLKRLNESKS
jgi:hypothetical protein